MPATRALNTASVSGVLALAGFQFTRAVDENLLRLHAPGSENAAYARIGNQHVEEAFQIWARGARYLEDFRPRAASTLIDYHVIADSVFVIAAIVTLAALIDLPAEPGASWRDRITSRFAGLLSRPYGALFVAAGVLGLLANGTGLWLAHCPTCRVTLATGVHWLSLVSRLAFAIGVLLFVAGYRARITRFAGYVFWCTAALRITLVFAAFFVVALYGGRIGVQSEDLVERWFAGDPLQGLWALLAYMMFVFVVASSKWSEARTRPHQPQRLIVAGLLAVVAGLVVWRSDWFGKGSGLFVLALITLALAALEGALYDLLPTTGLANDRDGRGVRIVVAAIPGVAIALLLTRVAANHFSVTQVLTPIEYLGVGLIVFPLAGIAAWWIARALDSQMSSTTTQFFVAVSVGAGAVAIMVFANAFSDVFGAFAALLTLLAAIAGVAFAIRAWIHSTHVPRTFGWVGFRRTPALTVLIVWLVATGMVNGASNPRSNTDRITFEDVRVLHRAFPGDELQSSSACHSRIDEVPSDPSVRDALCEWVHSASANHSGPTLPLVLVTASGGGVRAAAWTEQVLGCFFFRSTAETCEGTPSASSDRWPLLFAANGASGGSVGIASTVAERLANAGAVPEDSKQPWYWQQLGRDTLSPVLGSAILHDGALGAFGIFTGKDRSAVLADEWGHPWDDTKAHYCDEPAAADDIGQLGFITLARRCGKPLPRMLFNATDVNTGRRVNVAAIDYDRTIQGKDTPNADDDKSKQQTDVFDLVDYLDKCQDVSLFTAAFLSARFPLISSDGRVPTSRGEQPGVATCKMPRRPRVDVNRVLNLVDGGYAENSGSAQIGELWAQLSPLISAYNADNRGRHIRPVLVEIENGERSIEQSPATATGVGEFFRPIQAITNARLGGGGSPLDSFASDFLSCKKVANAVEHAPDPNTPEPDSLPVHVHLVMYEHPGQLLPLGWTLSEHSLRDIRNQYFLADNHDEETCFDSATR
jgi:hypothetical protein